MLLTRIINSKHLLTVNTISFELPLLIMCSVTFFKFSINHALAMLTADSNAISLEALSGLTLDTSTWGTRSYSSNIGLLLPSVALNIIHRSPRRTWHVVSSATVGATLDVYNAPDRWQERVSAQQEFLKEQDSETGRVWYMYRGGQKPSECLKCCCNRLE